MYGKDVAPDSDLPLQDSDPEATLPFRAVVAVPGLDETVDPPPRLQDPARIETRDEPEAPGTLPYGTVLPLDEAPPGASPLPSESLPPPPPIASGPPRGDEPATVDAPPPAAWIAEGANQAQTPPPLEASTLDASPPGEAQRGARLEGFELEAPAGPDPLGEWWVAIHGQFGPCLVLVLDPAQAAAEGPRLLIAARVAMSIPPDPRLELPVGTGALPRPWIAVQRHQSSPLDVSLQRGENLRPLQWARDLAGGLAALHAYGVAHGEISPATARIPTQGAARWSRVALRTKAGPPEALPKELKPGAAPTRAGDLYAFGGVLAALAPHVEESWRSAELADLAARLRSDDRPSAQRTLAELIDLVERPTPTFSGSPWLWGLLGAIVGAGLGALATYLALTTPR